MKRKMVLLFVTLLPLLFAGCFVYESAETHIQIDHDEDGKYAKVSTLYSNVSSCEGKETDARKDFDSLIEMIEGDEYLMDEAEKGMYLKERKIWLENEQVMVTQTGITRDFDLLKEEYSLIQVGEEYLVVVEKDETIILETNGKQVETDHSLIIYWHRSATDLYFKIKPAESCGSFDKNSKRMAEWLTAHQCK